MACLFKYYVFHKDKILIIKLINAQRRKQKKTEKYKKGKKVKPANNPTNHT